MTRDGLTTPVPPPSGGPCVVCGHTSPAAVEVGYIQQTSGPGIVQYACPEHAAAYLPGPVPDELDLCRVAKSGHM
ncbi:hypothetical protein B7R87_16620 [Streptomyces tsukubensis]|uniref:Uncharacterized protein n=1 Tax=Streptomyces tsukubensis (strain DSM 42081 / NBRC 108919 / NRRL 18488 / 9993) TaxID=1114943 RepID=A0A7G3UH56_STRT9|nr:hypothetical protein B7R87_16620 [Streptomyces tsukubensis]QKM68649.1 hypothetical protein STSU_017175 [Streptomyces tsukubensis NRRL18488]